MIESACSGRADQKRLIVLRQLLVGDVRRAGSINSLLSRVEAKMDGESFHDMTFPSRGLNKTQGFHSQLPETTPIGENVRVFEAMTERGRGGSRSGLSRFVDARVGTPPFIGSIPPALIQHINVIVTADGTALQGNFDTGTFEDPSSVGPSFLWPPLKDTRNPLHFIRDGGEAIQPYKNRVASIPPPPPTLAKRFGLAFSFQESSDGPLARSGTITETLSRPPGGHTRGPFPFVPVGLGGNPLYSWKIVRYFSDQVSLDDFTDDHYPVPNSEEIASGDAGIAIPTSLDVYTYSIGSTHNLDVGMFDYWVLEVQSFPGGQFLDPPAAISLFNYLSDAQYDHPDVIYF